MNVFSCILLFFLLVCAISVSFTKSLLGSIIILISYSVVMRSKASTKAMIDEMRQRNGNLEISCSRPVAVRSDEL